MQKIHHAVAYICLLICIKNSKAVEATKSQHPSAGVHLGMELDAEVAEREMRAKDRAWERQMQKVEEGRRAASKHEIQLQNQIKELQLKAAEAEQRISFLRDLDSTMLAAAERDRGFGLQCANVEVEDVNDEETMAILKMLVIGDDRTRYDQVKAQVGNDEYGVHAVCAYSLLLEAIRAQCAMGYVKATFDWVATQLGAHSFEKLDVAMDLAKHVKMFEQAVSAYQKGKEWSDLAGMISEQWSACKAHEEYVDGVIEKLQKQEPVLYESIVQTIRRNWATPLRMMQQGLFDDERESWCGCHKENQDFGVTANNDAGVQSIVDSNP